MSLKKNYFYNTANQLLTMIVSIVTVPYVSRILGVTNIGIYSYTYSIVSYFVMFITLGLNNYGNREVAKVRDNKVELNKKFSSIYLMQLLIGIFILIIYFIYIVFFVHNNKIIFIIQTIFVISAILDINWLLYGLEVFKITAIRNMAISLINLIGILIFVRNKECLYVYTLVLSLGTLANQLVAWGYIKKKITFVRVKKEDILKHIKPNLILFIPIIAVSLYKIMDKVMLGNMINMSQVGFYESSEKIIRIPTILISSLGTVMLPRMTNIYANNNKTEGNLFIKKSIEIAMILSSSLCFGIMSISKEFVPLFYGKGYEICIYLYLILLPSCVFLAFSSVIRTQFLIPTGKEKIYIKAVILGAITNLVINIILIPRFASIGAAIGTLCAEMVVCISQAIDIRKEIPVNEYFRNNLCYIFLGIFMFFILYSLNLFNNLFVRLIIKIVLGVVIYIVGLILIYGYKKYNERKMNRK